MSSATLLYDQSKPPFGLLAILEEIKLDSPIKTELQAGLTQPNLKLFNNQTFQGSILISRYLARLTSSLYGANPVESTEIDFFLDFSRYLLHKDTLLQNIEILNTHLAHRQVLVGYQVTIADYIIYESLANNPRWAAFLKSEQSKYAHFFRWYNTIINSESMQAPLRLKIERENAEKERKLAHSAGGHFVDLPGAKHGAVVTRFPPEPSGYLHIGHAK
jgi:glutamyl-tRNA synthetase